MNTLRLTLLIILTVPSFAAAQERDPWLGKRVFWKSGAVAKVGTETIDIEKISFPAIVGDVNGDWLWLDRAWVQKQDVMETQQALDFYTEKIRLNPSSADGWRSRGAVWNEKGEIENSIKDYTEAIRLDPKDATAHNNRGVSLKAKGDVEAAIKDYTDAIRLDPKDAFPYFNRGNSFSDKGDFDASIKDYTVAIRLDPKFANAYVGRAYSLRAKGDFNAAIKDYTEAIRLDPKDATAYAGRGKSLKAKGDVDAAIKDYNEAIRLDPIELVFLNNLAWIYATCPDDKYRDGKKAVELATKACELSDWKTWNCIGTLAAAYAESGDWVNAVKYQEQAIELSTYEKDKAGERETLELYKNKKPYREEVKKK